MMNKVKLAIGIITIAFLIVMCIVAITSTSVEKFNPNELVMGIIEETIDNHDSKAETSNEVVMQEVITEDIDDVEIKSTSMFEASNSLKSNQIAEITIVTDKKTKTYEIMTGIDEKTLKRNIGHLPSSTMPNEIGNCVLMGHRDTDFKILKYAEIGDDFYITMDDDTSFKYTVSSIRIIENDERLTFISTSEPTLTLVTCYPFRYTGHAPQKYEVKLDIDK